MLQIPLDFLFINLLDENWHSKLDFEGSKAFPHTYAAELLRNV